MKFALNQIGFSRDATDTLCWRGHNLLSLVEVCGTPSMVYDECRIVDNYNWFKALGQTLKMKSIVAVALKATGNVALLRALRGEGAFCEVMSEEEFSLALASGFTHHEIIVNGLGWADSFFGWCWSWWLRCWCVCRFRVGCRCIRWFRSRSGSRYWG